MRERQRRYPEGFWKQMGKCQRMELNFVLFIIFVSLGRKKELKTILVLSRANKKKTESANTFFVLFF